MGHDNNRYVKGGLEEKEMKEFYKIMFNVYLGAAILALVSSGIILFKFFSGGLDPGKVIIAVGLLFAIGIYTIVKSVQFYKNMRNA